MENKEIEYLKSFDYSKILTRKERFNEDGDGDYFPFILEGFYPDRDEANKILKSIDPDLYIAGDNNGGIEISRESFWK